MRERKVKAYLAVFLLIMAILSCTVGGRIASSVETYSGSIASIDKSIGDALKLITGVTVTSVVISLLPDDVATPVANQFSDFSDYLLFIVIILLAEKYLVTLFGATAFRILIPAACILVFAGLVKGREGLKKAGIKLIVAGFAISFLIPVSTAVSNLINAVYGSNIQATIEKTDKLSSTISFEEEQSEEDAAAVKEKPEAEKASMSASGFDSEKGVDKSKFKSFFGSIGATVSNAAGAVSQAVSNAVDSVVDSVKDAFNFFMELAKDFAESIAVMIVTSCIIPIAVLAAFVSMLKLLFGIDISGIYDIPNKIKMRRNRFRGGNKGAEEKELTKNN